MKDVPEWKRNVSASEECILVNADDFELMEILMTDGYHRQVLSTTLMTFDESLRLARDEY